MTFAEALKAWRTREPGVPRCWSLLELMMPWEREAIEPQQRPALPDGFRDPLALPPRSE